MKNYSKKLLVILLGCLILVTFALSGCQSEVPVTETGAETEEKGKLVVAGTADMIAMMEEPLSEMGYDVEIMDFSGLEEPAMALNDGVVDCVIRNNNQWVTTFNAKNGSNIVTMKPYLFSPVRALYSDKYSDVSEIPQDSIIVIATDGTNQERDLKTVEAAGLIKLSDEKSMGAFYTIYDIAENQKNIEFMTVDHTTAINYIEDVAAVITDARNVQATGLDHKEAILFEDPNRMEFAHGLMVLEENQEEAWVEDIFEIWGSDDFSTAFNELYSGTIELLDLE